MKNAKEKAIVEICRKIKDGVQNIALSFLPLCIKISGMKRVLVISDLCSVGQCSQTVALPVLSACGFEACPLPTNYLSTHSVGFDGYTRLSLAEEGERVVAHLKENGVTFDCAFSSYLGGIREVRLAFHATQTLLAKGGMRIVDPAMADNGELYPDLTGEFVRELRSFAVGADALLPNYTEACLLAGEEFKKRDIDGIRALAGELVCEYNLGAAVITGVEIDGKIGAFAFDGKRESLVLHDKADRMCHGAGDVFSSAFTSAMLAGKDAFEAAKLAEDFTFAAIKGTEKGHWYGVQFERYLADFALALKR